MGSWRDALWPPEAQGKPVTDGSSISALQEHRSAFAGQMEMLVGHLYLLGMPVVPRLWLLHAAPLPPDGPPFMVLPGAGWQPAGKVAGGGTLLAWSPCPQQWGPAAVVPAPR